jgi:alpha-galactosidase
MQLQFSSGYASDFFGKKPISPDSVVFKNGAAENFLLTGIKRKKISDEFGAGYEYIITGEGNVADSKIRKEITISSYNTIPSTLFFKYKYTNISDDTLLLSDVKTDMIDVVSKGDDPDFWSFQGESTSFRKSWILPVKSGFSQRNFMGMSNSDYGGGIPLTCLWRKDAGVSLGHISDVPQLISLPVNMKKEDKRAKICMERNMRDSVVIPAGHSFSTITSFVHVYSGDCFMPLREYSALMAKRGIIMPVSEPDAFESAWCAWGYERHFTTSEILATLPKVKELGIKWVTLDDGYQIAEGDWNLNKTKFPHGDIDMKRLVDSIHSYGLKAQIWWAPLAVDPGTTFLKEHPDCIMTDKNGKPYDISWWNSYYMSPIDTDVIAETKRLVIKFIKYYGFDGLKLDGQHLNSVHPDYNPAHTPDDPDKANRMLPLFFKMIYDTARDLNPHALIQLCPCGDCFSLYNMPYVNQFVASDPQNSWQVRSKGYVLRAMAPNTAYFGDHVELTDNGNDFRTQLGIGAVPGSKFTYPKNDPHVKEDYSLSPDKEKLWKKAFGIYMMTKISEGEYVPGYYDIGYDRPETHFIRKGDTLYYAFYAKNYCGDLDIKGLDGNTSWRVYDYFTEKDMGQVDASNHIIKNMSIKGALLLRLTKI